MKREEYKPFIARRVARELRDGDVVNLGIGLPTLVANYLPENINVVLHGENGIVGAGPKPPPGEESTYITDAGGKFGSVALGGAYVDSGMSFDLIRGGHVDCTVLGALQVDEEGNLANWIIPGVLTPGMGGAMDLAVAARKVIIAMEHTAKDGAPRILPRCTLPLTAAKCVDLIVTQMGVIEVTEQGLVLVEYNPEYTPEQVVEATAAHLTVSPEVKAMC